MKGKRPHREGEQGFQTLRSLWRGEWGAEADHAHCSARALNDGVTFLVILCKALGQ